jgi:hypothetical protein
MTSSSCNVVFFLKLLILRMTLEYLVFVDVFSRRGHLWRQQEEIQVGGTGLLVSMASMATHCTKSMGFLRVLALKGSGWVI